jgi:hypothetical protein
MSQRDTVLRSMHDAGLAAWFGGSLMGAVSLNGAAAQANSPTDRLRIASAGWDRWAPVNAAASAHTWPGRSASWRLSPAGWPPSEASA